MTWDQLLDKSNDLPLLLKFFRISRLDTLVAVENENSKRSGEIREHYAKQNVEWFECRDLVIQLVFNDLLKTQPRDETAAGSQKDLLFNTFLIINSNLFELGEINLIKKLKNTQFYAEMQQQSEANGVPNPAKIDNKKNFYSATRSSISITKLSEKASNGHECTSASEIEDDELNIELNELYEQFIQTSVKHMLSNSNKTGNGSNSIKKPKFFERLATLFDGKLKQQIFAFFFALKLTNFYFLRPAQKSSWLEPHRSDRLRTQCANLCSIVIPFEFSFFPPPGLAISR